MTKPEPMEELVARFPQLLLWGAGIVVRTTPNAMSDALVDRCRTGTRGFGSFGLNRRPSRIGHNPKSDEKVLVPEKQVPYSKTGKELRERVDHSSERQGELSSEGESVVSLVAVKAGRQIDSSRQTTGFPVDGSAPLATSH